jgi:hypothetical protein
MYAVFCCMASYTEYMSRVPVICLFPRIPRTKYITHLRSRRSKTAESDFWTSAQIYRQDKTRHNALHLHSTLVYLIYPALKDPPPSHRTGTTTANNHHLKSGEKTRRGRKGSPGIRNPESGSPATILFFPEEERKKQSLVLFCSFPGLLRLR